MKNLINLNLFSILVLVMLNLFSVCIYFAVSEKEKSMMKETLKKIYANVEINLLQNENQGETIETKDFKAYFDRVIINQAQKVFLELAEKEKSDMWNNFLKTNDMVEGEFMLQALEYGKDPNIAKKIVTEKNIEKYKETNPEFFKEVTKNGKKELVLLDGWANDRNIYQTANKENKQYHATESMNFIFDNMDDKQKDAIKIALNKDKNNAMTSGFIQMDKLFRSNSNDYGMIQNFINSYGSKGKELVYRLMTEDPTTDTLKSYVKDTETSEMIQKVTGLSGEEFLKQLRAFSSQAEKGLKSRGSAFKNQSDMIKVGKRDEKGNFTGNVTRLPLWTPYDDDINFEEENKRIEKNRGELEAIRAWMNDIHAGTSYSPEIHKRIIDDWLAERNKNK